MKVDILPEHGTPIDKIRAAVAHAEEMGIRILHGDWGVICGALSGEWVADPARRPAMGVSPLGAVVLLFQPGAGNDMPDPAAHVLAIDIAWCEGFSDGFDGEATGYYLGSAQRRLYLQGLEAGMEFRFELTVRCPSCHTRHFRRDRCPLCEARARGAGEAA